MTGDAPQREAINTAPSGAPASRRQPSGKPSRPQGDAPQSEAINTALFTELSPDALYGILRLRAEVFVVEQDCAFCDPDGRDTEPSAVHCWMEEGGRVVAYLRLLDRPGGGSEIGRVVSDRERRGLGLAAALVRHALGLAARPVHLNAQARLEDWYASFGFVGDGAAFMEGGILHVPMVLR